MRRAAEGLAAVAVTAAVLVLAAQPADAALPGAGIVTDAIGGASGWAFDKLASGAAGWVLGAVAYFADGVLNFLKTSGRPQVDAAWFAGAGSPLATVRNLAAALMGGFVFLGLLQGLVRGDPGAMIRRLAADVPMAVLGIVATVAVTTKLLDLTDALSTAVLDSSHGQALRFLSGLTTVGIGSQGFAVVVIGLLAIVAALLLWIELMVRSALVYLLVAVSPIAFAAMVWPAARGVLRRTAHLLVAVILSKFVIAVALAVGVAALGGPSGSSEAAAGPSMLAGAGTRPGSDPAVGLGALLVGGVILALAAFAPFIILRLIPLAEAALAAQGVSRGPFRATQSGLGTYYYTNSIGRLGGSNPQGVPAAPAPAVTGPGMASGGTGAATPAGAGAATGASAAAAGASVARAAGQRATATAHQAIDTAGPRPPARPDPAADPGVRPSRPGNRKETP